MMEFGFYFLTPSISAVSVPRNPQSEGMLKKKEIDLIKKKVSKEKKKNIAKPLV